MKRRPAAAKAGLIYDVYQLWIHVCSSLAGSVNFADPLDSEICGLLYSLWFAGAHDGSVVCVAARGALHKKAFMQRLSLA